MLKVFKHPLKPEELLELRGKIVAKGYRLKEFAKLIGYSPITLSMFLNGRVYSEKMHKKIIETLNLNQGVSQ
jgi:transcriptional regulator with XRE-family HTH domain